MSFYKKTGEVIADWNKEEFRKLFHEDFLFIRETELVTLDDHINKFNKFMSSQGKLVNMIGKDQGQISKILYALQDKDLIMKLEQGYVAK